MDTKSKKMIFGASPKKEVRAQTVCQRHISFPHLEGQKVRDLKAKLCEGRDLNCEELQVIYSGKECKDIDEIPQQFFVLVRNTAARNVNVNVKVTDSKCKENFTLSFPLNTRISKLKSLLLQNKHTKWSTTGQRLIASSKIMKDHHILGDYFLHTPGGKRSISPLTIYLSQTIDSKAEMEIFITLRNKQEIKFYFEFGLPLYFAKEVLQKQFGIPKDISYCFESKSGMVLGDMNMSLLDYGILPSAGKKMHSTIIMTQSSIPPVFGMSPLHVTSLTTMPTVSNDHSVTITPSRFTCPVKNDEKNSESSSKHSSHFLPSNILKKKPSRKRKSNTCSMFGGMKKGFLSNSMGQRKNQ
jgi:hypothetical protein